MATLRSLLDLQQALMSNNAAIRTAYDASALNENGKRTRDVADGSELQGEEAGEEVQVREASDGADSWETDENWGKAGPGTKSDFVESAWKRMAQMGERLAPYRDASVDRWQRKTLLSSGTAVARGGLRALNQSISQQVASSIANPKRLLQRTRLKKGAVRPLGQIDDPAVAIKGGDDDVERGAGGGAEDDGDPETFDDADFYQQLLREFLEMADPTAVDGLAMHNMRRLRDNKKKTVDRRASKGRKIRYVPLAPIVNFMAPEAVRLPPMAEQLFRRLFGVAQPLTKTIADGE
eukprot:TRINITY_DN27351_c0_g1_i1.p1 TRINITY_DN27351_c0_g1~~TRINITY_DN27351_c0_g1_i1.p1  ORF type:complete len:316 (-),score=76.77 TRINITY_DN27351_c0_g1_i1:388-1266(-)